MREPRVSKTETLGKEPLTRQSDSQDRSNANRKAGAWLAVTVGRDRRFLQVRPMIKTREQLLDEIERETLSKVRDLLRRGASLFEGTPDFTPPKMQEKAPDNESVEDWQEYASACKLHAEFVEEYAAKLHDALEQLHESLVDYESEAAAVLVDFDALTRQYDIQPLPPRA